MGNINRISKSGKDQKIISGIAAGALEALPPMPLGGAFYSPATLSTFMQSRIDAQHAIDRARAAWLDAIRAYEAIDAKANVVVRELRNMVIGAHGPDPAKLAPLGFEPPKQVTLTPEQKAAANEKRVATRKARGTMGRRQRLAIKAPVAAGSAVVSPVDSGSTGVHPASTAMHSESTR